MPKKAKRQFVCFSTPKGFCPIVTTRVFQGKYISSGIAHSFSTPKGFCPIVTFRANVYPQGMRAIGYIQTVSVPRRVLAR